MIIGQLGMPVSKIEITSRLDERGPKFVNDAATDEDVPE
jgi:hypothetical protein